MDEIENIILIHVPRSFSIRNVEFSLEKQSI